MSSGTVSETQVVGEFRRTTSGGSALFLHQDVAQSLEPCRHALSEKDLFFADDSEPGRSRTTPPCGAYSWRTNLAHGPLRHWCPELRTDPPKVSNIDSQRRVVHMSQLWRTHEDHRKAHGCRDPTALSSRVNRGCMKPLSPTRKLCVPRRAPHSSTSPPHLFPLKPLQRPSSPRFFGPRQLRPWQCEGLIPAFSQIEFA